MNQQSFDEYIPELEKLKQDNQYKDALKRIHELLGTFTDDYRLYEEMADIYLYEGKINKAEEVMQIAQKLHPESATGTYLMGYICISKGDFQKGIDLLIQANNLFPNNPEILRNLGWGYVMTFQIPRGILLLRRALNIAPDDLLIMEDLGMALLRIGKLEEASKYLKKAGREDRMLDVDGIFGLSGPV